MPFVGSHCILFCTIVYATGWLVVWAVRTRVFPLYGLLGCAIVLYSASDLHDGGNVYYILYCICCRTIVCCCGGFRHSEIALIEKSPVIALERPRAVITAKRVRVPVDALFHCF